MGIAGQTARRGAIVAAFVAGCGGGGSSGAVGAIDAVDAAGDRSPRADGGPDATAVTNAVDAGDAAASPADARSGQDAAGDASVEGGHAEGGAGDSAATVASGAWVMGYYSGWDSANLPVDAIAWGDLTHIATAFMIPDGNGGFTSSSDPSNPSFDDALAQSVIAAAHAAGKKAIASIGGSDSAAAFEASTTSANLATFVAHLHDLVTVTGYDGIDIDWEGGPTTDDALLLALVHALRVALPTAVITMTAGAINNNIPPSDLGSLYAAAAPDVDQINLMTYGMSGAYSGWKSWHSSPLHWNQDSATPVGIDDTVGRYLAAGVPANKLGVGAGFYGECYTSPVTAPDQALGASMVAASDGFGNLSYRDIVTTYESPSAKHRDATALVPYLTLSGSNPHACTYVTYEDPQSIAAKGAWAKTQGLGGAIVWTINEGYVPSAGAGAENALLDAMRAAFLE
jgi:chitinase